MRFSQIPWRYGIGYDGSRDALVSFEAARQFQLPLTGSFSSIGPITFGPWYYYYLIFANYLIPNRWAPWISIGIASLLMVFIMYKIGELLLNKQAGFLLSFITAISPAQIKSSTALQQHTLVGFLSSLVIYLCLIISRRKKTNMPRLFLLWGFILGVSINTHFQTIGLITIPFLYFAFTKKIKSLFPFIIGLFISMIPILFFELNNHWFNSRNVVDYILYGQYKIWTSNRWLTFLGTFIPEFWSSVTGLPTIVCSVVFFGIMLFNFWKTLIKKERSAYELIFLSFILQIIALRYYRGEKFFGYLQFFHPYILLFTAYPLYIIIRRLNRSLLTFGIIVLYFFVALPNILSVLKSDPFTLASFQRMNTLKKNFPDAHFSTYECLDIYDVERIQAITLLAYMQGVYNESGLKIGIQNPNCPVKSGVILSNDLIDLSNFSDEQLLSYGYKPITPFEIYKGTARWWFKEQP